MARNSPAVVVYLLGLLISSCVVIIQSRDVTIGFDPTRYFVQEDGNSVVLTVRVLAGDLTAPVNVSVRVKHGEARSASDYIDPGNQIIQFDAGTVEVDILISIIDDGILEGQENFFLALSSDQSVNISPEIAEVFIMDDEQFSTATVSTTVSLPESTTVTLPDSTTVSLPESTTVSLPESTTVAIPNTSRMENISTSDTTDTSTTDSTTSMDGSTVTTSMPNDTVVLVYSLVSVIAALLVLLSISVVIIIVILMVGKKRSARLKAVKQFSVPGNAIEMKDCSAYGVNADHSTSSRPCLPNPSSEVVLQECCAYETCTSHSQSNNDELYEEVV